MNILKQLKSQLSTHNWKIWIFAFFIIIPASYTRENDWENTNRFIKNTGWLFVSTTFRSMQNNSVILQSCDLFS